MLNRENVIIRCSNLIRSINLIRPTQQIMDEQEQYNFNIEADCYLINAMHSIAEEELRQARVKGKRNWFDCPSEYLKRCLHEAQVNGDYVAVMNYAMMIVAIENGVDDENN